MEEPGARAVSLAPSAIDLSGDNFLTTADARHVALGTIAAATSSAFGGETHMTTRETIERYLDALEKKQGWELLFADDMAFTSYVSPVKQVNGRDAYLQATKRFFS